MAGKLQTRKKCVNTICHKWQQLLVFDSAQQHNTSILHSYTRRAEPESDDGRSRWVWSWRKGLQGKACSSLCRWDLWSLSLRPCPFSWASQKSVISKQAPTFFFMFSSTHLSLLHFSFEKNPFLWFWVQPHVFLFFWG